MISPMKTGNDWHMINVCQSNGDVRQAFGIAFGTIEWKVNVCFGQVTCSVFFHEMMCMIYKIYLSYLFEEYLRVPPKKILQASFRRVT